MTDPSTGMAWEWCANGTQLDLAESALKQAATAAELGDALCTLAWFLRDRAPQRTTQLTAQALALPLSAASSIRARLAEAWAWGLLDQADASRAALHSAEQDAVRLADHGLLGDLHLVAAAVARMQRDAVAESACLGLAQAACVRSGEGPAGHRTQLTEAMLARSEALRGGGRDAHWQQTFPPDQLPERRDVAAYVLTCQAALAYVRGDFARATPLLRAAATAASDCGLCSLQSANYGMMATVSGMLGNPAGSMEYIEMALEVLRDAGHVAERATLQIYLAQALIELKHLDLARQMLDQAQHAGLRVPEDLRHATYCASRAWLERRSENWAAALAWAERGLAAPKRWNGGVSLLMWRAVAQAHLGDAVAAVRSLDALDAALGQAGHPYMLMFVRKEVGILHRDVDLPRPDGQSRLEAQFQQFSEALSVARGIPGSMVDPALLTELLRVHEARGDLVQALACAKERHDVIEVRRSQAAADREVAQAMRERLLQATADAEHHRDVAGLLEKLGDMGRRLNAEQDPQRVIAALVANAAALVPCDSMAAFRVDADRACLVLAEGTVQGRPNAEFGMALDDPHSTYARVVRERIDVLVEGDRAEHESAGAPAMRSRLYASLSIAGQVLGVLTLQAEPARAFGERAVLAMRALAAYGAVALANADNTQRLRLASEAKSMFLASMTHELRTPLNGILGFSQLLGVDPRLDDKQRSRLKIIHDCGEHLLALINDILDLSRIEAGHLELYPQNFDLRELLTLVADIARVKADEKNLLFTLDAAATLPTHVVVDDTRLRQVLINLLGNAVKFTDTGGVRLVVTARAPRAGASGRALLSFEVHDSGVGIAPHQLETIFVPFEQVGDTQRRRAGTGLGLTISRQIVQMMGGDITVRSTPGQGSVFAFEVDLAATFSAPAVAAPQATPVVGYIGPRRRVLVVDDTASARTLFAGFLDVMGFEVLEAENGLEALALAQAHRPDLVLMDHTMPVMGGTEATGRLRALPGMAALPVVSISATKVEAMPAAPAAERADVYLRKPIELALLARTIGDLLQLQWTHAQA